MKKMAGLLEIFDKIMNKWIGELISYALPQ